jgi:uncharacterized membrane protein
MMSVRLYLLLPLAMALASLHALPFAPRPDRLFGAAVPREIRYGNEGRQALRRYELRLLPWTAAALFVSLWLPLSWAVLWAEAAFLIPLIAAGWIFSRRRTEIRHLALPAPSTREARLTDADDRLFRQGLLFAIPLAILTGTALYLHLHWDAIPARFPVHWGANGIPNGWSTRSLTGVYGPLLLGTLIVLFQLGILILSSWGSRRSARNPAVPMVLIVIASVIATAFSAAGLLPLHIVAARTLVIFYIASFSFLAVMIWFSLRRHAESGAEAGEITPEACWHGDQFYYNPHDPALFVEKRIGLGLTFNFGNRGSWIVLAVILLIPVGLLLLAFALTKG